MASSPTRVSAATATLGYSGIASLCILLWPMLHAPPERALTAVLQSLFPVLFFIGLHLLPMLTLAVLTTLRRSFATDIAIVVIIAVVLQLVINSLLHPNCRSDALWQSHCYQGLWRDWLSRDNPAALNLVAHAAGSAFWLWGTRPRRV